MIRRARLTVAAIAALVAVGAAGASQAEGAFGLNYVCYPPVPASAANCYPWHTAPLTVSWDWNTNQAVAIAGDCVSALEQTYTEDTADREVTCTVKDKFGSATSSETVPIRIDKTPPAMTGGAPARPPDYNGWWNHPVDFSFSGSDATSGIASCDKVTYAGPDGAAATVSGSCRDIAGNSSTSAVPLKYDGTPPAISDVATVPADASAKVSWHPSADVVRSEVTRTPGESGAPSTRVFGGTTSSFTDVGLINGVTYTYTVTVFDDAGNSSWATAATVPVAPLVPVGQVVAGARATSLPLLRWRRITRAGYYNVQVFRGRHKILSAWPIRARFQLQKTWRFRGRRYHLTRARYHWYVWPGYGPRAARRYGALIRKGSFYYRP